MTISQDNILAALGGLPEAPIADGGARSGFAFLGESLYQLLDCLGVLHS